MAERKFLYEVMALFYNASSKKWSGMDRKLWDSMEEAVQGGKDKMKEIRSPMNIGGLIHMPANKAKGLENGAPKVRVRKLEILEEIEFS